MYDPPAYLIGTVDGEEVLHIFGLERNEGHYTGEAFVALRAFSEGDTFHGDDLSWRLLHDVGAANLVQFRTIHVAIDV